MLVPRRTTFVYPGLSIAVTAKPRAIRIWHLLADERSRMAVAVAESYGDCLVGRQQLIAARDGAREAKMQLLALPDDHARRAANAAQDATRDTARSAALNSVAEVCRAMNAFDTNHFDSDGLRRMASLLRCIVGNPFQPQPRDPAWKTPSVVALARAISNERTFDRLTELAEALEDAGCHDAAFLERCRGRGEHARGCWVVDTILGNRGKHSATLHV
jgi:hypothetical protein